MKRLILLIMVGFLNSCNIPFAYEYTSEVVELPSLSALGGYQTQKIKLPVDQLGIPFDDITFVEVLIRIEGENHSSAEADAELRLMMDGKEEIFFDDVIPINSTVSRNVTSSLLATGLNNRLFDFEIKAKNDQGSIDWEQVAIDYQEDFKDIILNNGLTYPLNVTEFLQNTNAVNAAMDLIDLKISVKISLIFKGVYKVNIKNLIDAAKSSGGASEGK